MIHRRDPRVKILVFVLLFVFLFVAPSWQWMVVPTVLGLVLAAAARTSWKWLAVLWAVHLPTFIVLIGIPIAQDVFAGNYGVILQDIEARMRLVLAWSAAIFVGVSLFSTMDPEDLRRGLRGLGLPSVAAFAVGLSYRLLYTTLNEIFHIADAMRIKGVELNPKRPFRFLRNAVRLCLPVLFAVVRRGPTLMCALAMRGLSDERSGLRRLDVGDVALLLSGLLVAGLALADRLGWMAPLAWMA